jgi:hypothetical protein
LSGSETHHLSPRHIDVMGFTSFNPSYALSLRRTDVMGFTSFNLTRH